MVSIKDVASKAGVSTATVSRTLSNPERVSEASRNRVLQAIRETGYVANTLARSFRRRQTDTVMVLVPDISDPFFSRIVKGIERVAHANDYRILLGDADHDIRREQAYAELVARRQADGLISLGKEIPFPYRKGRKTMDKSWPPFAMAGDYNGEIAIPCITIDNVAAAEEAVQHLLDLGHTAVGFINGPSWSPVCHERLKGYKNAMEGAGVKPQRSWIKHGDFSLVSGRNCVQRMQAVAPEITAVFIANDLMSIGAIQYLRASGIKVPEEISVVGFDDIELAAFIDPPLTTVHQPRTEMGEHVMSLMLRILRGEAVANRREFLPHRLIVRESTGPARAI